MVAAQEQGMGSSKDQRHNRHRYPLVEAHLLSIKGKRTKRPRPASPARITTALTMSSVSPSASACYNSGTDDEAAAAGATRPVTTTTAASSTTTASADQYPSQISGGSTTAIDEEEEDMAYCLILLAQGDRNKENNNNTSTQRSNDSRHQRQPTAEVPVTFPKETSTAVMESGSIRTKTSSSSVPPAAVAASSSAYAAYECKTCNRCFPSFQALGGHRASHKRPKQTPPDPLERKQLNISYPFSDHDGVLNDDGSSLSLQIGITASCNNRYHDGIITTTTTTPPYNKSKVHECSICGAVFSSGQALGGHMRRHRTLLSGGGVGGGASAVAANPVSSAAPTMIGGRRIDENIKEAVEDPEDEKRTRTLLSLDLNLPAPEDDHRGDHHHHHQQQQQPPSKFVFSPNDRTLLLSASSLVDCHY